MHSQNHFVASHQLAMHNQHLTNKQVWHAGKMLTTGEKKRQDKTTAFGVNEKPNIIPGCPGLTTGHLYSIGKRNARAT